MAYLFPVTWHFIWAFYFLRIHQSASHLTAENLQNLKASQFQEDHYYWNSSDNRHYPWLKVCNEAGQYEIQPGAWCSKGVHFPNGYTPGCVCPYGLWIVKNEICKVLTVFLLGDGRHNICFLVNFKIESLIFLGDPDNVFASKVYVAPLQLSVFYEIPLDGSFSELLDLDKPIVIHMFPINNRSIETEDGNCFSMIQPNTANVPIHIWSSALGPTRYRVVNKCSDPLNFGFDELISPNIVFVRSNLINVATNVPKPRQCSPSQVAQCNQFITTVRPPQSHTPRNHEALYYNLAKVSPDSVNKVRATQSSQSFPTMEVTAPNKGNASKLDKEQMKNVELPLLMSARMLKELRFHSNQNLFTRVWQKNARSSEEKIAGRESSNKTDDDEEMLSDNQDQDNNIFLGQLDKAQQTDPQDDQTEGSADDGGEPWESDMAVTPTSSGVGGAGRKRSIGGSNLLSNIENAGEENMNKMRENSRNVKESLEDSGENYPSGWCLGQLLPPGQCNLALATTINSRMTQGTQFLQDLLQNFDINQQLDSDLGHIISFLEKSAQLFHKLCTIPEAIMPAASWQTAMRLVLARVGLQNLKQSFATGLFDHQQHSPNKEGSIMENCSKDVGKIEFLFEENCPLKISCVRYSISPDAAVKVITITKPEGTFSGKTILTITLESVVRFLEILCQSSWQDMAEPRKLKNVFSKLRHVVVRQERESSSFSLAANFIEKDVQSFLKISNVPAYLMLLEKCVMAAETISENRGTPAPSSIFRPRAAPLRKQQRHKGGRIVRETGSSRSSPSITTKHERVPRWVFDGSAICMDSYWDGVNRSNKDHDCIPSPSHR